MLFGDFRNQLVRINLNFTKLLYHMKTTVGLFSIILFTGCLLDDEDTVTTTVASEAVVAAAPSSVGSSGLARFQSDISYRQDGLTLDYSNFY